MKKEGWSKEAKHRHADRLLKRLQESNFFDSYANKKKNLDKITDDFTRY